MSQIYSQLMLLYHRFSRYYAQQFLPLLQQTGLSLREIRVLLFLANNPKMDTARDVTEYRGLAKSQVSAAVDLLVEQGMLRRQMDSADRRIVHLFITKEAQPLVQQAQGIQDACWKRMLEGLSQEEQGWMHVLLEKAFATGEKLAEGGRSE